MKDYLVCFGLPIFNGPLERLNVGVISYHE